MKVLYINYLFDKTYSSVGAAVHVREFVAAAKDLGVDIKSYDLNKFGSEEAAAQSRSRAWLKSKLSRYLGQLNALISNVGYFRREWRIISDEKPDALLVRYNLLNFSIAIVARLKRIPLVLEVNSPMALENRTFNKNAWQLPLVPEWTERLTLKLADRVYTVSIALRNYFIEQGVDAKKISVIPNGVDIERFRPENDGSGIREKYGLQENVVLGFIGSFHYWHGVECLEAYIERLWAKYGTLGFLLVGDGPLKASLEEKFRSKPFADKVVFAGYVEHEAIPQYLAAMDIVLAPYPALTFFYFSPLKLFEYMAAGKAVVASRVGQIEEMVEDGVSGLLCEPGDVGQLVTKCRELIRNEALRRSLGENARASVCDNYSWRYNASRVVSLLKEAANGSIRNN